MYLLQCEILKLSEGPMLKEFKEFAMRGNVLDMAVGIIIGAAFGKIVSSFVADILMPPISLLMGNMDISSKFIDLTGQNLQTLDAAKKAGAATLNYGIFINTIIDFLLVAFAIFLLIKQVNKFKKPQPAAAPTVKDCPFCASSIPLQATRCPHCTSQLAAH
jgi:large conductance mechanosensitive channel